VSSTPAMNIVVPSQARSMPSFTGTEVSEGTPGASTATDMHVWQLCPCQHTYERLLRLLGECQADSFGPDIAFAVRKAGLWKPHSLPESGAILPQPQQSNV
jgi:hypothetical protein